MNLFWSSNAFGNHIPGEFLLSRQALMVFVSIVSNLAGKDR